MSAPRRGGRGGEAIVVNSLLYAEISDAHGQFKRAPAMVARKEVAWIEGLLGNQCPVYFLFAGQQVGRLHLPGPESDVPAHGASLEPFFGKGVFGEHSEGAEIV